MAARIVFIGDPLAPGHDPVQIELDGVVLPLGEAVEVSDEALAAKLARHSHFSVTTDEAPVAPEPLASGPTAFLNPAEMPLAAPIKRGPGRPRKSP